MVAEMSTSTRWKALERDVAEVLGGRRIHRRWDLFESAPDVVVEDFGIIADCKAYRRFAHHTLLDTVAQKYCNENETPALVTKAHGQHGAYITVPLEFFRQLLAEIRTVRLRGTA